LANESKEWESVKRILIPNNDENWVQLWWNVSYIGVQRVIERDFQLVALNERSRKFREKEVEKIEKGDLVLTNKNVYWLEKRGRLRESLHIKFVIPLKDIVGVYTSGWIFKNLHISDGPREYTFNLKDVEKVVQIIRKEVYNVRKQLPNTAFPSILSQNITCPICEQQVIWIQSYSRFYCCSCKQYFEPSPLPLSTSTKIQEFNAP
jgi:hypothetical protein